MKTFYASLLAFALVGLALNAASGAEGAAPLRLATFRCDVTPPLGEPMVWVTALAKVETPLLAKGIILESGADRYVLCAFDWCLMGNHSELAFRQALARAAQTRPERVAVHCIHQHDAPYADEGAHRLLDSAPSPPPHLSDRFLSDVRARLARAAADALARLEPCDRVGFGQAAVERVASARRLRGANGKIIARMSTGAKVKAMAQAPEGDIDPDLRTITFARGERPLARLHYYATHPQTVSCDGRATADFVGDARESLEREEGVFQVYFTGCAGDVTVGKYNDATTAAYSGLRERLLGGMRAAVAATRFAPAAPPVWRTAQVAFPLRTDPEFLAQSRAWLADPKATDYQRVYAGAIRLAFYARQSRPVAVSSLQLGAIRILHLPGEPMLEFQKYAQRTAPGAFVAVAGLGDYGPAYICTDQAFKEGGYEPIATAVAPGSEQALKGAIRRLLGLDAANANEEPKPQPQAQAKTQTHAKEN